MKTMEIPDHALQASSGGTVNLVDYSGTVLLFFYPYTGTPGIPDPPGWDDIKGAHGSTPQTLSYNEKLSQFTKLNVALFGISLQDHEAQSSFAIRNQLKVTLLCDETGKVSDWAEVPRFKAGNKDYLVRTTVLIDQGRIVYRRDNIMDPQNDAQIMLDYLSS